MLRTVRSPRQGSGLKQKDGGNAKDWTPPIFGYLRIQDFIVSSPDVRAATYMSNPSDESITVATQMFCCTTDYASLHIKPIARGHGLTDENIGKQPKKLQRTASTIICHTCKQSGHKPSQCPNRKCHKCEEPGHTRHDGLAPFCNRCKELGHYAAGCKNPSPKCDNCSYPHKTANCRGNRDQKKLKRKPEEILTPLAPGWRDRLNYTGST